MAKHRAISEHSLKARTVIGGVVASGALLVVAPAGMALADRHNPAPGGPTSQTAALKTQPQELDKRLLAAFGQTRLGQAVFTHLETSGNPRDTAFLLYLETAP